MDMRKNITSALAQLIYVAPVAVLAFREQLGISVPEAFLIIIGSGIAMALLRTSEAAEKLAEKGLIIRIHNQILPDGGSTEEEEEVETSGAGAFAGMVAGGAIGLMFGSAGVIIGGILGAIIGDLLEYEQEEKRKKHRRR